METPPDDPPPEGATPPSAGTRSMELEAQQWALDVYEYLPSVLTVLTEVASGDLSGRIEGDFPEDQPLGALCLGVNSMVASLRREQARNEEYQRALEEKLATIDQQRTALRELSSPIMEVWEGILCLPIVGIMDSERSSEMTDALLRAVVASRARGVILDITGIDQMDTGTADHFIRMAKAVRLLGASCVLTGMNPQIAQTIANMGFDMSDVVPHRSLRDALQRFIAEKPAARR